MSNSAVVKQTVHTVLKGKYLKYSFYSLIAVFVWLMVDISAQLVSVVCGMIGYYISLGLLGVFVFLPLLFGLIRVFRRLLFGVEDKPIMVFYYFSDKGNYLRAIELIAKLVLTLLGIAVLVFLPAIVITALSNPEFYKALGLSLPVFSSGLWLAKPVAFTICFAVYFMISVKYYLVPFLFVADENMDISEIFHMSRVISKKSAFDYILLIGSLILYILASVLIAPLMFTIPMFICSYLVHCRFATANYNMFVKKSAQKAEENFYSE